MKRFNFKRAGRIAAVAAAIAALSACGSDSEPELIASAKGYLQQNDRSAASIELKKALQLNPQSGEARYLLGKLLHDAGNFVQAGVELEKAHDLKYDDNLVLPLLARVHLRTGGAAKVTDLYARTTLPDPKAGAELKALVGIAYAAQGKSGPARSAIDQALRLDPKSVPARLQDARLLANAGQVDEAGQVVEQVIADAPRDGDAWLLKGELLATMKGDTDGAITAFRTVTEIEPTRPSAYTWLTDLLLRKGDVASFRQAIQAMQKALPNHLGTRYQTTRLALMDNQIDAAREGTQQLLKAAPGSVEYLQLAGAVEYRAGALLVAENHLVKVLQQSPQNLPARRMLGESYLRSGQPDKALDVLRPLLEGRDPPAWALSAAATARLQRGESELAERLFRRASTANPNDETVQTALALTELAKGRVQAGFDALDAIAAKSTTDYADIALIVARMRRNEGELALKAIDRLQAKQPDRPLAPYMRGQILAQRGDTEAARQNYEKALKADPSYFQAVASLAALDVAAKRPEAARQRYEALLQRDPRDFRALLALVELRIAGGDRPEDIVALIGNAVKANPSQAAPRLMLVNYQLQRADVKSALTAANEAVAALPADPALLDALGRAQLAAGENQQAVASFGKVVSTRPEEPMALVRLAEAQSAAKDTEAARESYRRALRLSPGLLSAQIGLASIAQQRGQHEEAIRIAREIQRDRPKDAVGHLLESEIQAGRKAWEPALAAAQGAMQRGRSSQAAVRLHGVLAASGRTAEADRFAAGWIREKPDDALFAEYLGTSALSRRDYAGAEAQFRRLAELQPNNAQAPNNIAWLMVQQNKPGAVAYAERAVQLAPNSASALDTLAGALAAEKQWPRALEVQRRAVARAPESNDYRLALARLLIESGERSAARGELEKLAQLGDKFAGHAEVNRLLKTL